MTLRASRDGVEWSFSQRFTVEAVTAISCANSSCVRPSLWRKTRTRVPIEGDAENACWPGPESSFMVLANLDIRLLVKGGPHPEPPREGAVASRAGRGTSPRRAAGPGAPHRGDDNQQP